MGIPLGVDQDTIVQAFEDALQPVASPFSMTLQANKSVPCKEGELDVDQLVISFANESDFSVWYDFLQTDLAASTSLAHIALSPYTLFQVYALLAINQGIAGIERQLASFQPLIPPLPSEDYCSLSEEKTERTGGTRTSRRMTNWIEGINQTEDFVDLDLDQLVDAQLTLHSASSEGGEDQFAQSKETEDLTSGPRERSTSGWIPAPSRSHSSNARRAFLS
jgi:hypothetical protein